MSHDQGQGLPLDRRSFLHGTAGLGLLAALRASGLFSSALRAPEGVAKAKRCIYLFMTGGPSQMDLFDYKPELQKNHGKKVRLERRRGDVRLSPILGSQQEFVRCGETGQWCSQALPHIARHMDELAVIRSLYTDSFAHGSALLQMNSGQVTQGHPSMGAWIHYALGSENKNLPGFVVMHDPRGGPISGTANWSSGYMPAEHQGTLFRPGGVPILDLFPEPTRSGRSGMSRAMQRRQIDALSALNALHAAERAGHSELAARSGNYELAYAMQETAPEALDLSGEDARTLDLYALNDPKPDHPLAVGPAPFGRQCLIARRLIERGVRFVQIYHGGGHQQQTWDAHHGVEENLSIHCPEIDRPIAGLLTDLKQRGLLDETLVIWGGEFGRMPVSQEEGDGQVANSAGRDHNPKAMTVWLAGAGVRPGGYGETDELSAEAAVDAHHIRDLHATVLRLMGLDHRKVTYRHGGLDRKLTGVVEAEPIEGVLA
jgi:hypothetical protein